MEPQPLLLTRFRSCKRLFNSFKRKARWHDGLKIVGKIVFDIWVTLYFLLLVSIVHPPIETLEGLVPKPPGIWDNLAL